MSIIKLLPENLINQIAAGEVVERPASVVKELVENSLDSGATAVTIDIKEGGEGFIKVGDNGCGISKEDLKLAVKKHATSKINAEGDLWGISTMGFRGEALSSIASVSKLTIKSKQKGELAGNQIDYEEGEVTGTQEVGMSEGTRVEVYDLFYNTPARKKYLKNPGTEFSHISVYFNTIAMANPHIHFKLFTEGRIVSDFPKVSKLIDRIPYIFGDETANAMIPVFYGGSDVKIDGLIGKPFLSRTNSQHQYIFVNGRPIRHPLLANRIKDAYHSMLMEHKKPVFMLNISIDPALIDVNVHPRKLEIRFQNQENVIKAVYGCVKKALEKSNLSYHAYDSFMKIPDSVEPTKIASAPSFASSQYAMDFSRQILKARERQSLEKLDGSMVLTKAISQVANSYIVAENEDGLILIDQHAGHERVRYEELMDQFENKEKSVQPLLVPQSQELTNEEIALVEEKKEIFEKLGFDMEGFGGNTFIVRAVPACLANEDIGEVIKGVLDDLMNDKPPTTMQGKIERMITYMACRSAIKFGQKLSIDEMQSLILQMEKLKRPYTCPHGRPTSVSITLGELEKMFKRT